MSAPQNRFNNLLLDMLREPLDPAYAAAARRRAERGPGPWWARASSRAVSLLVVAVIGFLFTVAYQQVVAARPESARIRDQLADDVRAQQATTDQLARRADELRAEVDRLRETALAGEGVTELRTLAAAAGLGRVRGDGVVIELRDAPPVLDPVTGAEQAENLGRVLDRDLQTVVNALWHAGAEAIAINDQRLSSTSAIRAAGSAILVDFKPVTSPYRVAAIGPADLNRRFDRSPTGELFREIARRYKMSIEVRRQKNLTLPAATDPQLRYARPPGTAEPYTRGEPSPSAATPSPVPSASGGP
ncbi:MAG: DUF881 domain-containing protein [Micromonosporaceae bacterium]